MLYYKPEKQCCDHTGRYFASKKEMCEFWNIMPETFNRRIKYYGYSLEEALTIPVRNNSNKVCYDHQGNRFRSKSLLCSHWNIDRKLFDYRLLHGWSLEDALTKKTRTKNKN